MDEFKVGDKVYVSKFGVIEYSVKCPVCFGKRVVTLILGDDSAVELECDYCKNGIGTKSSGYRKKLKREAGTDYVLITEVRIKKTHAKEETEYMSNNYIYYSKDVFAEEAKALAASTKRAELYNIDQRTKAEFIKANAFKSYSWNAGYHMNAVKDAEEKLTYHSEKAKICKDRSKGEPQCTLEI